jgi:hypothetical protein
MPLTKIIEGQGARGELAVAALHLGEQVTIIGASAEVVSSYAPELRTRPELLGRSVMLAGCMGDTYGYLPTEVMRREGGYEGGDFCRYFGLGAIRPEAQANFQNLVGAVLDDSWNGLRFPPSRRGPEAL